MSGEWVAEIDPSVVYFTFSRIRPFFSCGRPVADTLEALKTRCLSPEDLPTITLLFDGRHYFSLNNRRLFCMKELHKCGLLKTVKARVKAVPNTKRMIEKYTPEKCSLVATLMKSRGGGGGGGGGGGEEGGNADVPDGVENDDDDDADMMKRREGKGDALPPPPVPETGSSINDSKPTTRAASTSFPSVGNHTKSQGRQRELVDGDEGDGGGGGGGRSCALKGTAGKKSLAQELAELAAAGGGADSDDGDSPTIRKKKKKGK